MGGLWFKKGWVCRPLTSPAPIIPSHYFVCDTARGNWGTSIIGWGARPKGFLFGYEHIVPETDTDHCPAPEMVPLEYPHRCRTPTSNLPLLKLHSWFSIHHNCDDKIAVENLKVMIDDQLKSSPVVVLCLIQHQKQQAVPIPACHPAASTNQGDLPQPTKHCHHRGDPLFL